VLRLQVLDQLARPRLAGEVGADVDDPGRPLRQGEQAVEGGDAVRVGRRHLESAGDLVDRTPADPPGGVMDGMERRQQQVPPLAEGTVAPPAGRGRPEEVVKGGLLGPARRQSREPQIHGGRG
jgi:hypothetical protein